MASGRLFSCVADCDKSRGIVHLLFGRTAVWSTPVRTVPLRGCSHTVCIECVASRPQLLRRCPVCTPHQTRQKRPVSAPGPTNGGAPPSTVRDEVGASGVAAAAKDDEIDMNEVVCEMCTSGDDEQWMVLCDGCPRGFHTYCLSPKLHSIPRGDWYCPRCAQQRREKRAHDTQRAVEFWRAKKFQRRGSSSAAITTAAGGRTASAQSAGGESSEGASPLPPTGSPESVTDGSDGRAESGCAQLQPTPDPSQSGFVEFTRQRRAELEGQGELSRSAIFALVGREWRELPAERRSEYRAAAAAEAVRRRDSERAEEQATSQAGPLEGHLGQALVIPVFSRATRSVQAEAGVPCLRPPTLFCLRVYCVWESTELIHAGRVWLLPGVLAAWRHQRTGLTWRLLRMGGCQCYGAFRSRPRG
jgi:hypothetical protein